MLTVSDTAYTIATMRALEGERVPSERLFEDPYAKIFRAAGSHAAEATQRFIDLPVMVEGVRLRTRFLDDFVREGLAAGARQVVLFGSGFDMRAHRLPEVAAHRARAYEVDFAALLDHKRALLGAAGVSLLDRVACVPCDFMAADFASALTSNLEASGFRRDARTLFVWEGVIGYLDDAAIERSLRFMAAAGAPGSKIGFDYVDVRFDPLPVEDRARAAGFAHFESFRVDALWKQYLRSEPDPIASGLKMGVATR